MITRNQNLTDGERDAILESTVRNVVKTMKEALEGGLHDEEAIHFVCFIIFSQHRTDFGSDRSDEFMKWVCNSVRLANTHNN